MEALIQRCKLLIRTAMPMSSDAILVFCGLAIYLLTCLVFRLPLSSTAALLPPVLASIFLEAWEIFDYYGIDGLAASSTSQIGSILLRHSRDVLLFNLAPVLVCFMGSWLEKP